MNRVAIGSLNYFGRRYEPIVGLHFTPDDSKSFLGKTDSACRFCGRGRDVVSFKKAAHAVPHNTGNRWLFSNYECDECNARFGRLLENDFGNFMHLNHTVFDVKGKNGRSKFVLKQEGISIINDGVLVDWRGIPNEDIIFDPDARQLTVKQKMPGYVPVAVYKTLVKIALTIMPDAELVYFTNTLEWINEHSHTLTRYPFERLWLLFNTFQDVRWDQLSVVLSKRKDDSASNLPYMLFNLSYATFDFQLPVPLCSRDNRQIFEPDAITYLPHLYDMQFGLEKMQRTAISFHGREVNRGQEMTFTATDMDGSMTMKQIHVEEKYIPEERRKDQPQ